MSIWSNGTETMEFISRQCEQCEQCVHHRIDDASGTWGCPVTDTLILSDALGTKYPIFEQRFFNDKDECLMFIIGKDPDQLELFTE